jgi:uncharacterized membrane-anchored protein YhcB (DUF1043 family)
MNARSPVAGWLYVIAALLLGVVIGAVAFAMPAPQTPVVVEIPSNMQLLGEVTTVMDQDDPLVAEMREADELRAANDRVAAH